MVYSYSGYLINNLVKELTVDCDGLAFKEVQLEFYLLAVSAFDELLF